MGLQDPVLSHYFHSMILSVTGEDLYNEYLRRNGGDIPWSMIDPECISIWEAAARSINSLKIPDPMRNIRALKAGRAF